MAYQGTPPGGLDTSKPHPARVYDYLLGGRDNYTVDQDAAEDIIAALPRVREAARENRRFLHRAVRTVVGSGVRQIIDIGTGIPTPPNTHEIAQAIDPRTRVVYVDKDPVVQAHAYARLIDCRNTAFALADLRDPRSILSHPAVRAMIDFDEPVAVFIVAVLHFVTDPENPARSIAALRAAMAPGSHLVLTHATADDAFSVMKTFRRAAVDVAPRARGEVLAYFDGFELLEPGLVTVAEWRPDQADPPPVRYGIYAGVGVKQ